MTNETPPASPDSLPKYLSEGLPKQDSETLADARDYIDALIAWSERPIEADELPDEAEPVDERGDSSRGTVVKELVTCGDETCHCMSGGDKHGPYLYRYFREGGSLTSEYVGKP